MTPDEIGYVSQSGVRWAMRQILRHKLRSGLEPLLLIILGTHADADGVLYPSQERLADITGASSRSVERAIANYVQKGLLRIEVDRTHKGWRMNTYHLAEWDLCSSRHWKIQSQVALSNPKSDRNPPAIGDAIPKTRNKSPPAISDATPDIGDAISDTGDVVHPTPVSDKDTIRKNQQREKRAASAILADNARALAKASPASPPPAAPAPPRVVVGQDPALFPDEDRGTSPKAPRPDELVAAWNTATAGTPLISIHRSLTKAEAIRLNKALKHPAIHGDMKAWTRYCRWAAQDRLLRGDRADGYPADLRQIVREATINRWAASPPPRQPSLADVPLETLRKLDLNKLAEQPAYLAQMSRNPELLVKIASDPVDPRQPRPKPIIEIVVDRNARMRHDPKQEGSRVWQEALRDPGLRASLEQATAETPLGHVPENERPGNGRGLYGQKNGPSVDAPDFPEEVDDYCPF